MQHYFFLKGLILGLAIAAPVGPIGILCIRRTLQYGRFSGLLSGLGAALADSIYALIAVLGLARVSPFLSAGESWLRLVGGFFLLYLGWKTYFAKISSRTQKPAHTTLLSDFFSTFFLTLTNPLTILSFLAVFAGLGLWQISNNYVEASLLMSGICLGSALWWLILSEGITLFRTKINNKTMLWINRSAGILIILFGLAALFFVIF